MANSGFSNATRSSRFNTPIAANLRRYQSGLEKNTGTRATDQRVGEAMTSNSKFWQCTGCDLHHYFCWPVSNPGLCDRCGSLMHSTI